MTVSPWSHFQLNTIMDKENVSWFEPEWTVISGIILLSENKRNKPCLTVTYRPTGN